MFSLFIAYGIVVTNLFKGHIFKPLFLENLFKTNNEGGITPFQKWLLVTKALQKTKFPKVFFESLFTRSYYRNGFLKNIMCVGREPRG
jgi:hypothetical protein